MAISATRGAGTTIRLGAQLGASFGRTFDEAGRMLQNFGSSSKGHLGQIERGFSGIEAAANLATAAIIGSTTAVYSAVSAYRDLEIELMQVQYLYKSAEFDARKFQDTVQNISVTTGAVSSDITQGAFRFASAGGTAASLGPDTMVAAQIAQATNTSTEAVSRAIAQGKNLTGYTGTQFADFLVKAAQESQTDVAGIARYAPRLFGGGGAAGLTGAETLGLFAGATQLTGTTEEATTGLRQIFNEVIKPDSKFAKTFEETFGKSIMSAMEGEGAAGFMEALTMAFQRLGPSGFIGAFGSVEGGNLASLMVQNQEAIMETVTAVTDQAVGSVEEMWKQYQESVDHSVDVFTASARSLKEDVGEAFAGEAKEWLDTLSGILQDPDIKDALITFAESATGLVNPLRDIITPMAELAAAMVNFAGGTNLPGTNLSLLDALFFGALTGRSSARVARNIKGPKGLQTGGIGGALGGGVRGAIQGARGVGPALTKTGRVASSVAHTGLLGYYGYSAVQAAMTPDEQEAAIDAEAEAELDRFAEWGYSNTVQARKMLSPENARAFEDAMKYIRTGTTLDGEPLSLEQKANILGNTANQIGGYQMMSLMNKAGVSSALPHALTGATEAGNLGLASIVEGQMTQQKVAGMSDFSAMELDRFNRASARQRETSPASALPDPSTWAFPTVTATDRDREQSAFMSQFAMNAMAGRGGGAAEAAQEEAVTRPNEAAINQLRSQNSILREQVQLMREARDQRDDIIANTACEPGGSYSQFDILRTRD